MAIGLPLLPKLSPDQVYVKVAVLEGGRGSSPDRIFVADADQSSSSLRPSLCFLIEHQAKGSSKIERLVFDLGIKRDVTKYAVGMQPHIATKYPMYLLPDCAGSLMAGGLDPATDIDTVILSHVHWDHIGTPSDFPGSKFIVGSGTTHIIKNGAQYYPKEMMNEDTLPEGRTYELPPTPGSVTKSIATPQQTSHTWISISSLPNAIDYFGDGSLYLIDAPGHLQGHTNALLRVQSNKWIYLGGDCCHGRRIMTGEKSIAMYDDGYGTLRSVHSDHSTAVSTLHQIRRFLEINGNAVEWVLAHDAGWAEENKHRFFPNYMC